MHGKKNGNPMKRVCLILILCLLPCAAYALTAKMNSFNTGEVTPKFFGRTDLKKLYSSLQLCENFHVRVHGAVSKRPGTYYIATAAGTGKVRVVPFVYSTDQGRVLEFSNESIRFYKDE